MEAVLFSRRPIVDLATKLLAAVAIAVIAIVLHSIALGIFSALALILARETYFQNRLVGSLRKLPNSSPNDEHMPLECVEAVMPELTAG